MTAQVYSPARNAGTPSPRYSSLADDPFSNAHRLSDDASSAGGGLDVDGHSIMTAPPPYDETAAPFLPSVQLQIETQGKPWLSFPLPLRPDPIPIFTVPTDDAGNTNPISSSFLHETTTPKYISLRPERGSGSCFLIDPHLSHHSSSESNEQGEYAPLSTTTYRFGPGRPPLVRLYLPGKATPTSNPFLNPNSNSNPDATDNLNDEKDVDLSAYDSFPLRSKSLLSRSITFRTRLGTFEWRYASRKERKLLGADSLLVLDRVVRVPLSLSSSGNNPNPAKKKNKKREEEEEIIRTPVARFIRNAETRTPGSGVTSAGNGGRLLVDLHLWDGSGDEKVEREMVLVMVVTTVMVMLKKEVDRRRAAQIAIMSGAASGGGP